MFFGVMIPLWIALVVAIIVLPFWTIIKGSQAIDRNFSKNEAIRRNRPPQENGPNPITEALAGLGRRFANHTRRPRFLGMALDVLGLVAFAALLFSAFKMLDYWAFKVPVTPSVEDLPHVEVYGEEDPEKQFLFSVGMLEVNEPTEFCCDFDHVDHVTPTDVASEGYKIVYVRRAPVFPAANTIDRRTDATKLVCSDRWGIKAEAEAVFAYTMRAIRKIPTEFRLQNWYMQTTGLRDTEMYVSPVFWETCNHNGGCMDKYMVLGAPNRPAYAMAHRADRLEADPSDPGWEDPDRDGWTFLRTNNPYLKHDTFAFILDSNGLIRATMEHEGTEPALQILSALRVIVEADGHDFPDELRPYHLTGDETGENVAPLRWAKGPIRTWLKEETKPSAPAPPSYLEWLQSGAYENPSAKRATANTDQGNASDAAGSLADYTRRAELGPVRSLLPEFIGGGGVVPERWRFGLVTGPGPAANEDAEQGEEQ